MKIVISVLTIATFLLLAISAIAADIVLNHTQTSIYVPPGGTSDTWEFGTGWYPPGSPPTSPITRISFHEVNHAPAGATPGAEDVVLTIGKFQYSSDSGLNWVDYVEPAFVPNVNTFNTNFISVSGKIWRFVHNNAADTTTSERIGYAYYVSGYSSSIGTTLYIRPDLAPNTIPTVSIYSVSCNHFI